jgi:PAS domain-containing protein
VTLRRDLVRAVRATDFREAALALCERHDLPEEPRRRVRETEPAAVVERGLTDGRDGRARRLVWRLWTLDAAPLGLVLAGPAYRDTPVVYATRTARDLTGYGLGELRGENLRRLQGPGTEPAAVADLREAVASWNEVTVDLRNYRADGTAFRNRVTLAPLAGPDGAPTHWLGVQGRP